TLCALLVVNVRRGITGRRLLATRSNERAASSLGISVMGAKVYAFALGAGIAATGGVLGAFRYPNVRFDAGFSPFESIPALMQTFLGGIGFIGGAIIGGMLFFGGVLNEVFSHLFDLKEWQSWWWASAPSWWCWPIPTVSPRCLRGWGSASAEDPRFRLRPLPEEPLRRHPAARRKPWPSTT